MMNSATLKPVSPQNSSVNQINKPMHPQSHSSFSQPSGHMPPNSYPNMNAAHNHPNAQKQNHYSLNVPNAPSHYNIPPSNHPVANVNQSATGLQSYTPPKTVSYAGGYQSTVGHSPPQNTASPAPQVLPATQPPPVQQQTSPQNLSHSSNASPETTDEVSEKPQSNGTDEEKPISADSKSQDNHVSSEPTEEPSQPEHSDSPEMSPQTSDEPTETPIIEKPIETPPIQERKSSPEPSKVPEEVISSPIQSATLSMPQSTAIETDPLAIETPEAVPSPSKPEVEEGSEIPTENPFPEESVAVEATPTQENNSESVTTNNVDQDLQEENETKNVDDNTGDDNTDMDVDKEASPEKETSAAAEVKPVSVPKEVKKPKTLKPKESNKPVKPESKSPLLKTPTSSKAAEKRQRIRTQPYQSPLPEIEIITKISSTTPKSKGGDDKLIYFYKNEFLAVRNAEGGFYLCQAIQNIYKSSSKIKIRWLSQDKNDKSGEIYTPDFYDLTDFDCILTSLDLARVDKAKYRLTPAEKERTDSILNRSLAVEKGEIVSPSVSQEHPDGLDLSLFKDEEQLKKKKPLKRKLPSQSSSPKKSVPTKKSPEAPKVRKVETKAIKKVAVSTKSKKPTAPAVSTLKKPVPPKSNKNVASTSRAARGKRKSDTKTSPVVDLKKAKVLAKIGRKTAIPASTSRSQINTGRSGKTAKPVPSTTKPVVPTKTGAVTRKNKRSTRK